VVFTLLFKVNVTNEELLQTCSNGVMVGDLFD
jgi:hypothetical protein